MKFPGTDTDPDLFITFTPSKGLIDKQKKSVQTNQKDYIKTYKSLIYKVEGFLPSFS